jgi:hypothetical protein
MASLSTQTQQLIQQALDDRDAAIAAHGAALAAHKQIGDLDRADSEALAKARTSDDVAVQAVVKELGVPAPAAEAPSDVQHLDLGKFASSLSKLIPLIVQVLEGLEQK